MAAIGKKLTPQLAQNSFDPLAHPLAVAGKSKAGIGQPEGGCQAAHAVAFLINAARQIF